MLLASTVGLVKVKEEEQTIYELSLSLDCITQSCITCSSKMSERQQMMKEFGIFLILIATATCNNMIVVANDGRRRGSQISHSLQPKRCQLKNADVTHIVK